MFTIIDEPISVGVVFSSGKINPKFFVWKGKRYPVERITFLWDSKEGSAQIFHFATINNGSVYEISYNLITSNWKLDKIHEQW
jgi:hypothetical protein